LGGNGFLLGSGDVEVRLVSGVGEAFDELTQTLDVGPLSQTAAEESCLLSVVITGKVTSGSLLTVDLEVTSVRFFSRLSIDIEIEASSQQPTSQSLEALVASDAMSRGFFQVLQLVYFVQLRRLHFEFRIESHISALVLSR
jgi:hypothetical protein